MSNGRSMGFILAILSIQTTVALAAFSWAYLIHGRLVEIETSVEGIPNRITAIERQTLEVEFRVVTLENKSDRLHPE